MGKPKEPKGQEDRLREGIYLLTHLKTTGIKEHTLSYMTLKQHITAWIKTGEPFEDHIPLQEYQRMAHLQLPRYTNRVAELTLKAHRF